MTTRLLRTYTDLKKLLSFEERFEYLATASRVGDTTFGGSRFLNQDFYRSKQWREARSFVIARDRGLDLGVRDRVIQGRILVHHMIPLIPDDFALESPFLLDPEYLITVSHNTHNAIHYGTMNTLQKPIVERRSGDTTLW